MAEPKVGDTIGRWKLLVCLGKGGNGVVWKVCDTNSKLAAMKISIKPKNSAFERFKAEIHIHLNHHDVPGVLPVIDYSLPDVFPSDNSAWFVMPLAKEFTRVVRYDFREIVTAVISVAETLALKQASAGRVRALFLPRSGTQTALAAAAGVDVKFTHGTLLSVRWLSA